MATNDTVKKLNTFLNPLTTRTWSPEWFTPFGPENYRENRVLFHAAALLATYGALGYGVRKIQNVIGDDEERRRIDKAIKSHVESQTPILSPDPDINDDESISLTDTPYMNKKKNLVEKEAVIKRRDAFKDPNPSPENPVWDSTKAAVTLGGLFIPALAAYTAYMYGNRKSDEMEDAKDQAKQEKIIDKLENIYQRANMERLLAAKGYTPEEILQEEAQFNKTAEDADIDETLAGGTGKRDTHWWQTYGRAAGMLLMLGLGGLAYGSYKVGSHYLEEQDPERKKRKAIKRALEQRLMNKQPTRLIGDFGPKLKAILDKPAKKQEVPRLITKQEPVLESAPEEETDKSLTDLLSTV